MKIAQLAICFIAGATLTFFLSARVNLANSVKVAELNGKLAVMESVCPVMLEKGGFKGKK